MIKLAYRLFSPRRSYDQYVADAANAMATAVADAMVRDLVIAFEDNKKYILSKGDDKQAEGIQLCINYLRNL